MIKWLRAILIIFSIIIVIFAVQLVRSGQLEYYILPLSSTCQEKCADNSYKSSQCVLFPCAWSLEENPCEEDGVNKGMAKDCKTSLGVFGGHNHCCCYN